jgi:hypothetical protein
MRFSPLLVIMAIAIPLSACVTAEQIAANDDATCRSAGLKPDTPAYTKCREDKTRQASQQMFSALNQANQLQMQQQQTMMMMRH